MKGNTSLTVHRFIQLLVLSSSLRVNAFIQSRLQRGVQRNAKSLLPLLISRRDDSEDMKRKMELVRTLQQSFYSSGNSSTPLILDHSSGIIENLPLWRVQWTELPGRCNVLNVHEPLYTNMFEKILYGTEPLYFGHLYLSGGSKNINTRDETYRLKSWNDVAGEDSFDLDRSAIIGTLMRISDFRRMSDGKLLLLVQALERFVITDTVQELPYSVANVQLLPDLEEMEVDREGETDWLFEIDERNAALRRQRAIAESIRYHEYEYDANVQLPVPQGDELSITDVIGSTLVKVLPFIPFSSKVNPAMLGPVNTISSNSARASYPDNKEPLEYRLLTSGVLRDPDAHTSNTNYSQLSSDDLEMRLWICIDDYLTVSKSVIRPELLSMLPPSKKWPKTFALEDMAKSLASTGHYFVRVTDDYPAYRRRKRLSYAAAAILEHADVGDMRRFLLEIPCTNARLIAILEELESVTTQNLGEFL